MRRFCYFASVLILLLSACQEEIYAPTGRAYIYGISEYANPYVKDLPYPRLDAVDMEALWDQQGIDTVIRVDGQVDRETIIADLKAAAEELRPTDVFVFFFAGHGAQGPLSSSIEELQKNATPIFTTNYLALEDYTSTRIDETSLTDEELGSLIDKIPSTKKFILLDCCYSGGFIGDSPVYDTTSDTTESGNDKKLTYPVLPESTFGKALWQYVNGENGAEAAAGPSTYVMTAATNYQRSWDNHSQKNGYFTGALVDSAYDGDQNGDGYVTFTEAYKATSLKIQERKIGSIQTTCITRSAADPILFKTK